MRISTAYYYNRSTASMQAQQTELFKTQQQIGTGRRIVSPSDDPLGASRALQNSQFLAASQNNTANIKLAQNKVAQESTYLDAIRGVLGQAQNIITGSGGTPSDRERADFAIYLQQQYDNLLAYANSTDANGNYIFAGSRGLTLPFQQTTGAANYQGDNEQLEMAINGRQTVPTTDSGQRIFGVGTADDPFAVISQFITDLQNPALTGSAYQTAVNAAMSGIDNALENVISVQSEVAGRDQLLKAAESMERQFTVQYQNELARIESVDIQEAAVTLKLQETTLQAIQQSFVNASQLSLFNFM